MEYKNYKVVYRRYASLYFIIGIDNSEVSVLCPCKLNGCLLCVAICNGDHCEYFDAWNQPLLCEPSNVTWSRDLDCWLLDLVRWSLDILICVWVSQHHFLSVNCLLCWFQSHVVMLGLCDWLLEASFHPWFGLLWHCVLNNKWFVQCQKMKVILL